MAAARPQSRLNQRSTPTIKELSCFTIKSTQDASSDIHQRASVVRLSLSFGMCTLAVLDELPGADAIAHGGSGTTALHGLLGEPDVSPCSAADE
jgi:hypothetical protein